MNLMKLWLKNSQPEEGKRYPGTGNREPQIRWTQEDPHQDIIKIPKVKERILKATREKQRVS